MTHYDPATGRTNSPASFLFDDVDDRPAARHSRALANEYPAAQKPADLVACELDREAEQLKQELQWFAEVCQMMLSELESVRREYDTPNHQCSPLVFMARKRLAAYRTKHPKG